MAYRTRVSAVSGSREENTVPERARERADCPVFPGQQFQSETLPVVYLAHVALTKVLWSAFTHYCKARER